MARSSVGFTSIHTSIKKKTSQSGKPSMVKFGSMNKDKKASYKKYRGQGR
jgi:hypothetical protein